MQEALTRSVCDDPYGGGDTMCADTMITEAADSGGASASGINNSAPPVPAKAVDSDDGEDDNHDEYDNFAN